MKTGVVIEAEVTDKGLNHFTVKRVFVKGEDWVDNEKKEFNIIDANNWIDLMVEGITTVIYTAHDCKIKDSAEYLREVIGKLEQAFIKPAETTVNTDVESKDYSDRNNDNDFISSTIKEETDWININERLPEVRDDFETMLETQQISKPVLIKLSGGRKNKETDTDEIDGYFVKRNGINMWSLDECGTGQYYPLELATHWKYKI